MFCGKKGASDCIELRVGKGREGGGGGKEDRLKNKRRRAWLCRRGIKEGRKGNTEGERKGVYIGSGG